MPSISRIFKRSIEIRESSLDFERYYLALLILYMSPPGSDTSFPRNHQASRQFTRNAQDPTLDLRDPKRNAQDPTLDLRDPNQPSSDLDYSLTHSSYPFTNTNSDLSKHVADERGSICVHPQAFTWLIRITRSQRLLSESQQFRTGSTPRS